MAKRPRFLPEYVTKFRDRHGKVRYRYRRKGHVGGYFKSDLGSDEFRREYAAFEAALEQPRRIGEGRHPINSVADIVSRYVSDPTRLGPSEVTQRKVKAVLDRFVDRYGTGKGGSVRYIPDVTFETVDKILAMERIKRPDGLRTIGGVEAARKLRKELIRLFDFAEKIGVRPLGSNPVRLAEKVKVAAGAGSQGHHSWTEDEIAQYRGRHPLGSNARLALELLLWLGQRRGDVYLFGPQDATDGRFDFRQGKTGKPMRLALAPQLVTAITAMPALPAGATSYLLTEHGKPYSYAGFGNKMREWCDQAGLPHCSAHGLRKANARRMAELGMSNSTLKAVGGWSQDREVATYTAAASQALLADDAIAALSAWEANCVSNRKRLTSGETVENDAISPFTAL